MKIIAFIIAILSAATVATLAFTTVPTVQKQSADNAAAIETIGGAVSDNSEAIEQIQSAIENIPTEEKKLYLHSIYFLYNTAPVRLNYYTSKSSYSTFNDFFNDLTTGVYIVCESMLWKAFKKQNDSYITALVITQQSQYSESSFNPITNITSFSDSPMRVL